MRMGLFHYAVMVAAVTLFLSPTAEAAGTKGDVVLSDTEARCIGELLDVRVADRTPTAEVRVLSMPAWRAYLDRSAPHLRSRIILGVYNLNFGQPVIRVHKGPAARAAAAGEYAKVILQTAGMEDVWILHLASGDVANKFHWCTSG